MGHLQEGSLELHPRLPFQPDGQLPQTLKYFQRNLIGHLLLILCGRVQAVRPPRLGDIFRLRHGLAGKSRLHKLKLNSQSFHELEILTIRVL